MSLYCWHFFDVCTFIDCTHFEGRTTSTHMTNYFKAVSRDGEVRLGQNHDFFLHETETWKNYIAKKEKFSQVKVFRRQKVLHLSSCRSKL